MVSLVRSTVLNREVWSRYWRKLGLALLAIILMIYVVVPGALVIRDGVLLKHEVRSLESANRERNFQQIESSLSRLQGTLAALAPTLRWMNFWRWVPGVGTKYVDSQEALQALQEGLRGIDVLNPVLRRMAPLAGYRLHGNGQTGRTGEQKVSAFVRELPVMGPKLKQAFPDFQSASLTLNQVHPADFSGVLKPIGEKLAVAQSLLDTAVKNMPLVYRSTAVLRGILGSPHPVRYLLIFQNSGELRSTGGFMTAYGYLTLNDGRLGKIVAQNMYLLDAEVTYRPPASTVISTYLPVYYWHLRDANTSPNVPTTVGYIKRFYASIPHAPHINGVIFVDTWFVDKLIGDVNGISVPTPKGPVTLNQQDANSKMEYMAEGEALPSNVRKKFIGTMMKTLFHDVLHSHGIELARVLTTVNQSLNQKFVLLSFNNPRAERLVERYNWGGTMVSHYRGDYLEVVDENLLAHKDNFVMHYHLRTQIKRVGSRYEEISSITYVDPAIDNGFMYVPYQSWVRFYVPLGSQLISITGVDGIPPETYNNLVVDKTVFGGHENLPARNSKSQPVSTGTVTVTYWLPPHLDLESVLVQMQPGINHETISVQNGAYHKTRALTHDEVFQFRS